MPREKCMDCFFFKSTFFDDSVNVVLSPLCMIGECIKARTRSRSEGARCAPQSITSLLFFDYKHVERIIQVCWERCALADVHDWRMRQGKNTESRSRSNGARCAPQSITSVGGRGKGLG